MATHAPHGPVHAGPTTSPHHPPTPPAIATPKVKMGKIMQWIIGTLIAVVILAAITINWLNGKSNEKRIKEKSEALQKKIADDEKNLSVYDLSKINYDDSLLFEVKPGFTARIDLTNDWCPYWSSGPIDTYDSDGTKRILDGNKFIQGSPLSSNSHYFKYQNNGTNSITIKIGRCRSFEKCTLQF